MRCKIVGAGLAGVAAAYFLTQKGHHVTLFDEKGVGAGASSIPAGLLHPYPGKRGLKSKFSEEAMELSLELLNVAEKHCGKTISLRNGIFRFDWTPEQMYDDLEVGPLGTMITTGLTVYLNQYLPALFDAMDSVEFVQKKINTAEDVGEYDCLIWAVGVGFERKATSFPIEFVKGQALILSHPEKVWERTMVGLGHISPLPNGFVQVGASYEHHPKTNLPDKDAAYAYLGPRVKNFLPPLEEFTFIDCVAGFRVCRRGTYLPIVEKISDQEYVFTALGSRGLLYHAYYGRLLADMIE